MTLRVYIPTAGTGSRLGSLTRYINKSLVSVDNRPTISHIVERYPLETEFVIALGHKGHLVRDFLELAYPKRIFLFAEVSPFEGPSSGLGLSLLACKDHLQQPFVFQSCDTLIDERIGNIQRNWMAFADTKDRTPYRTLRLEHGQVAEICEKGGVTTPDHKAYIGVAGIFDFAHFWKTMEEGGAVAIEQGESMGLRTLLDHGIQARRFTWYDTGGTRQLEVARAHFQTPDGPNILEKSNEAIWFVGDRVIKFSDDPSFIANRVARVSQLGTFVPGITGTRTHMYAYDKVEGEVLSSCVTPQLFQQLLSHSQAFWSPTTLDASQTRAFRSTCDNFYKSKTLERVALFYKTFSQSDGLESINGEEMPLLDDILSCVDWKWLSEGAPGRFHGDFHFENILWSEAEKRFVFLDWRQDFGGDLHVGDIHYDFAKLLHGLIVNHEIIANNHFDIDWQKTAISFDFHRRQSLVVCEQLFYQWLEDNGFDTYKVKLLTALIYLNIAALHHYPYSLLLYALGKQMLFSCLQQMGAIPARSTPWRDTVGATLTG